MKTVFCCFLEFYFIFFEEGTYTKCVQRFLKMPKAAVLLFGLTHVITLGCEVGSSVKCANVAVPFVD